MKIPSLRLKRTPRRPRVIDGHPWAFGGEVDALLPAECNGQAATLLDLRGRPLGTGLYNSKSSIVWRRFSRSADEPWNAQAVTSRLDAALARREKAPFQRLVWAEADDLPGLIVDCYGDFLVVQANTLGMDRQLSTILDHLQKRLQPTEIVVRNDSSSRQHEGMEAVVSTRSGKPLDPQWLTIEGIEYEVDLMGGQKTGFYLDQREQHVAVAQFARGRRVLDAFCHQGGFALQCARAGAASVLALDSSAGAVAALKANASRNGLSVEAEVTNVFDYFSAHRGEGPQFDLIVLDPPAFARRRDALAGALRGYKELNLRAMRLLAPGGILATYTCSHPVDRVTYRQLLLDAANDVRRTVRLMNEVTQPLDHSIRLDFPESEYLRGYWLQVE